MRAWPYPLLLAVGGCAGHGTTLTILPPELEGGAVGGVAVIASDGNEVTYNAVGQSVTTGSRPRSQDLSADRIAQILAILPLPPRPITFTIRFDVGSTTVPPEIVDEIRAELARRPSAELLIEGHTDSVGPADLNDQLSLQRAMAVADQLRAYGLSVDNAEIVGRGERESVVIGPDGTANALNRRVEVTIR